MADIPKSTVHTAEIVCYEEPVIITERVAVAAFIAGYSDPPVGATQRIYGSLPAGVMTTASTC